MRIPNYENYNIDESGNIYNADTGNYISTFIDGQGCVCTNLSKFGKHKKFYVCRLVADTYLGPLEKGQVVKHKNGNKRDNNVSNLEIYDSQGVLIKEYHGNKVYADHLESLKKKIRLIDVYNLDYSIEFESVLQAALWLTSTGLANAGLVAVRSNISVALKTKTKAYGYKWEYV